MKRDLPDTAAILKSPFYLGVTEHFRYATGMLERQGGIAGHIRKDMAESLRRLNTHNPFAIYSEFLEDPKGVTLREPAVASTLDNIDSNAVFGHHGYVHFSRNRLYVGEKTVLRTGIHAPVFFLHAHVYDRWQERVLDSKGSAIQTDNPYNTLDFKGAVTAGLLMLFWADSTAMGRAQRDIVPIMLPMVSGGLMLGNMVYKGKRYFSEERITYRNFDNGQLYNEQALPTDRWEPSREIYIKTLIGHAYFGRDQRRVFDRFSHICTVHADLVRDIANGFMGSAIRADASQIPEIPSIQLSERRQYAARVFLQDMDALIRSMEWQNCAERSIRGGHTLRL